MEEPKLLLTVRNNKNNRCIIEILNRLYLKDLNAKAEEVIRNVITVFTTLSPIISYGLLISAPPSCLAKIYPIDLVVHSTDENLIIEKIVSYIRGLSLRIFETFYVDCYNRGIDLNCRQIEIGIGLGLRGYAKTDFKNPDKIIVVNVVKNSAFLSIIKRGQEKVSVNPLR